MERFRRSFEKFEAAFKRLEEVINSPALEEFFTREFYIEIISKRFEYTYESLWKCSRDFLRDRGIQCNSPRSCFENIIKEGVVEPERESVLADMILTRNQLVHVYDAVSAQKLVEKIRSQEYLSTFRSLIDGFRKALRSDRLSSQQ